MDLAIQASTAKCQIQHYRDEDIGAGPQTTTISCDERDSNCTGLRWPTLSREETHYGGAHGNKPIQVRVPDVSLEKVLDLFPGDVWLRRVNMRWQVDAFVYADTPLEAACAALLAA